VAHIGEVGKQHLRGFLRRLHKAPGAPFAAEPAAEPDVGQIGEAFAQPLDRLFPGLKIDMDHHRRPGLGPEAHHLPGTAQGRVAEHHETDATLGAHAQFPRDIRPRISSWRQLM
jgi:hypothetical protein